MRYARGSRLKVVIPGLVVGQSPKPIYGTKHSGVFFKPNRSNRRIRHTGGPAALKAIDMITRTTFPLLASMLLVLIFTPAASAALPEIVLTPIATGVGQPVMLANAR